LLPGAERRPLATVTCPGEICEYRPCIVMHSDASEALDWRYDNPGVDESTNSCGESAGSGLMPRRPRDRSLGEALLADRCQPAFCSMEGALVQFPC
jgi:hypothetical protein